MKNKLLNSSPLIFTVACTLLAIIIAALMFQSYSREQVLVQAALLQQAEAVERNIYSIVKKTIRNNRRNQEQFTLKEVIQQAIEQAGEQAGVEALLLSDESGKVVTGVSGGKLPSRISENDLKLLKSVLSKENRKFIFSKRDLAGEHSRFFTVISRLKMGDRSSRRMMGMHHSKKTTAGDVFDSPPSAHYYLIYKLNLDEFNSSFSDQKKQVTILFVVFILVALGGWTSVLTLRGFKKSQDQLASMSSFNKSIVSSLPVGLIGVDGSGSVQLLNKVATDILVAISSQKISIGSKGTMIWQEIFSLSEKICFDIQQEVELQSKNEKKKIILIRFVEVEEQNDVQNGYVVVLEDVTQQRDLQDDLQKNARLASLGKMAAGVAHELRNPLSSIKGLGVLLQTKFSDDSEEKQTAQVLVDEVDRLNRGITELLDFAKPIEEYSDQVCIQEVLHKVLDLVSFDAKELGLDLDISLPESKIFVLGHSDKLNQVFLNLLLNSMQALVGKGVINLNLSVGEEITIDIVDNGPGLSKELLEKVFDPYFTTKSDGTGLGLSISAKIIEEHGGRLSLKSELGKGTVATVALPSIS
ncbi:MAG: ATP-binding protein [Desulfotalea sp.]